MIHRPPNAPAERRQHQYSAAFAAEMAATQRLIDDEADWQALEARAKEPQTRLEADIARMAADDDAQRAAMLAARRRYGR